MAECGLCGHEREADGDCPACLEGREQWVEYLTEFRRVMYPALAPFGLSFGEAFLAWQINRVRNAVPDRDEPDEPWKG